LLQYHEPLRVQFDLLADAESPHELIDALSFLAFACSDAALVDILLDMDLIASSHKGRVTGGGLEELREHPGLG
jgi:hypothetical protein